MNRFWAKVCKTNGCWTWTASKNPHGYGQIRLSGKLTLAHRVSWTIHNGVIPEGLFVLHICDNPPCVRPDHLFLGTQKDNIRDAVAKKRHSMLPKTHCIRGHDLNGPNIYRYNRRRQCRLCYNLRRRRRRANGAAN